MTEEQTFTERKLSESIRWYEEQHKADPGVTPWAIFTFLEGRAGDPLPGAGMGDAEKLVAWLREAADELENAHSYLGEVLGVPQENPETGRPFTLAARIAYAS